MVKFGVGCSTNWDSKVAGVEATVKALEQVNYKPKFLLIFCTIHYAKEKDGLKKLLAGCRSLVEDDVPSIGGTVTGFICPEGCHTRGVVVAAGEGKGDIDIETFFEENATKHPKSSGEKLRSKIKKSLDNTQKENKLIIEIMHGPIEPRKFAFIINSSIFKGFYRLLPNKIAWFIRDIFTGLYTYLMLGGPAREEDILQEMTKSLDDYYLIGCSSFDDFKSLRNYQFYNDRVLTGSTVGFGLGLNASIISDRYIPLIPTGKKFRITRGWNNFSVDLIEGSPAVDKYIELMGWPSEYIKPHIGQLMQKIFYHTLGYKADTRLCPFPAGFFFVNSIFTNRKIKKDEIELLLTSSKKTGDGFRNSVEKIGNRIPNFTLIVASSMIIAGILGGKTIRIKEILEEKLQDLPYLVLFGACEHVKKSKEEAIFDDYSIAMIAITG